MKITKAEIFTPREIIILIKRAQGKSWGDIGEYFGVSKQRIRQIERKAMRKVLGRVKATWG